MTTEQDFATIKIEMTAIRGKVDLITTCLLGSLEDHATPSLVHRVTALEEATTAKTAITLDLSSNRRTKLTLAASVLVSLIAAGASIAASLSHH